VKKDGNNLILTDDGYILRDLKISGFEVTTRKREHFAKNRYSRVLGLIWTVMRSG